MSQLEALLLSILIEAAFAAVLVAVLRWGTSWRAGASAGAGTLSTHWAVWAVMPMLAAHLPYAANLLVVEAGVVLIETPAYRFVGGLSWGRAASLSLAANTLSTAAGLLIYALG